MAVAKTARWPACGRAAAHPRWLHQANPALSEYITELLGNQRWITHLDDLAGLRKFADDPQVQLQWMDIKRRNKVAAHLQ